MKLSSINFKNIKTSMKFAIVIPIAMIVRIWKRNLWIITERPDQARDNGYCFFKYLCKEKPSQIVYYIIDKNSNDYQKIRKYKNVIHYDSWKHFFYYCLSKVHISAHINGCCPSNAPICKRIKKVLGIKDIFIPHGVSYGISEFCLQKYARVDLFICSGQSEYENVLKNYGYSEREVAYTGFPRLDGWHNLKINPSQIVLMPTWRLYLAQNPDTIFVETSYFKAYQSLIANEELGDFLVKKNLKLIFYLHNEMRKYVYTFHTKCPNIEVVYQDNAYDIQELLKSSVLLITDYSSVHFDFAYMGKPVIYYQFDKDEFFQKQYRKGQFDVEKNGFGPVIYNLEELISQVQKSYYNSFKVEEKYYIQMRQFYRIYDNENCERVYNVVRERIERGDI